MLFIKSKGAVVAKAQYFLSTISIEIEKISTEKLNIIKDFSILVICLIFVLCIATLLVIVYGIKKKASSRDLMTRMLANIEKEKVEASLKKIKEIKETNEKIEESCEDELTQKDLKLKGNIINSIQKLFDNKSKRG